MSSEISEPDPDDAPDDASADEPVGVPPGVDRAAVERSRAGLRRFVGDLGRDSRLGLRRRAPYAIAAALVAAALAPVVGPALGLAGGGVMALALTQLGAVGVEFLGDAVVAARRRLAGVSGPEAERRFAELLAEELATVLDRGDAAAEGLRQEMADLLQHLDAVPVLLRAAVEEASDGVREEVAEALVGLGRAHAEFGWMLESLLAGMLGLQHRLTQLELAAGQQAELNRRALLVTTLLRSDVEQLIARQPAALTARPDAEPDAEPDPAQDDGPADGPADGLCPYPGLQPFRAEDAAWFHGREQLTAELLVRLAAPPRQRPQVVVGASGSGKSSLLRAGLLAALTQGRLPVPGSRDWPVAVITPGRHPVDALAAAVAGLTGQDAGALAAGLRAEPVRLRAELLRLLGAGGTGALGTPLGAAAVRGPGTAAPPPRLLLVVDQFEELFTLGSNDAERQAFLLALEAVASAPDLEPPTPALVLLGVRSDQVAACLAEPVLREAFEAEPLVVGPMRPAELRAAIERPAADGGWPLEPGLVEVLLRDLAGRPGNSYPAGALPLLGHALRETWVRRTGRRLTIAGYTAAGGIERAVAATAEQLHDELDEQGRAVLRRIMVELVNDGPPGERTRRRERREDLVRMAAGGSDPDGSDPDGGRRVGQVLDRLVAARLLTAGDGSVELSHEAVIEAWPRLGQWLEQDADALREQRRIAAAAAEWVRLGRDPGALLRGLRLQAARAWADDAGRLARLSDAERELLDRSLAAEQAAEQRARSRTRRLAGLSAALAVLLVAATLTGVLALRSRNDALQQRQVALSNQLAAQSRTLRDSDPLRSELLALAAWRASPTLDARGTLLSAATLPDRSPLRGGLTRLSSMAASPDGRTLAVGGPDGIELWDVTGAVAPQRLSGRLPDVQSIAFSPDGAVVAAGGIAEHAGDIAVRWWQVRTGRLRGSLGVGAVGALAFGPDGLLTTAEPDGVLRRYRTDDGRRVAELPGAGIVWRIAFTPDGRTMATAHQDGTVGLWDVGTGRRTAVLRGHTGQVRAVAFTDGGRVLLSGGADATVRRWSVADRRPTTTVPVLHATREATFNSVSASADGSQVWATGGSSQPVGWETGTGIPIAPLLGLSGNLMTSGFGPDGHTFYAAAQDGTVGRWVLGRTVMGAFTRAAYGAVLSPDGRRTAASADDGQIRIWDTGTQDHLVTIRRDRDVAVAVQFSPDGRTLATSHTDGRVRLWDPGTGRLLREADADAGRTDAQGHRYPSTLAFSPDGSMLAFSTVAADLRIGPRTGDTHAAIVRWDLRTGRLLPDLPAVDQFVHGLGFASGGRELVAAYSDSSATRSVVRVWGVADGRLRAERPLPQTVDELTIAPDGRLAVLARTDRRLELWDVPSRRSVGTLPTGVAAQVRTLVVAPDGRTVGMGALGDHLVHLLDLRTGEPVATLDRHVDQLTGFGFGPGGRTLVSAAEDSAVVTWPLDPADAVRQLCGALAGPGLVEQWRAISPLLADPPCG